MIGRAQKRKINSSFPPECIRVSLTSGIKNVFLVERNFSFPSFTDFKDPEFWRDTIKAGNIIPLFDNLEFEDQTEETKKPLNGQNFFYLTFDGKYRFMHHFNYAYDFANNLKIASQGDYDYIFSDRRGNLIAYSPDGIQAKGFETDLVLFEKMVLGSSRIANWTKLFIELSDPDQLNKHAVIYGTPWSINRTLRIVPVDVVEIVEGSIKFRVIDSIFGSPVLGLSASDVVITDDIGSITFTEFIRLPDGYYHLNGLSSVPTFGEIEIDSSIYYGSGVYTFGGAPALIQNLIFNSVTDIEFDVVSGLDASKITGLTIPDFTITDDINGGITIGTLNESAPGHYRLNALSANLTTGDIDLDDGNYVGTTSYDANIAVEVYDFTSTGTSVIFCKVRESISLNPVSGLVKANFEVDDNISGILIINNVVEGSPGEYSIYLAAARSDGDINISTVIYSGTGAYDFSGPTVANAGYTIGGATDWIDSDSDGKADGVNAAGTTGKTFSIVTNPGFTGNAQRVDFAPSATSFAILILASYFKIGQQYKMTCKFRSDQNFSMSVFSSTISESVPGIGDSVSHTIETGNFTPGITDSAIQLSFGITSIPGFIELDEIFLIET